MRHARSPAGSDDIPQLVDVIGRHKEIGGTADPKARVLAHGLVQGNVIIAYDAAKPPGQILQVIVRIHRALGHALVISFCGPLGDAPSGDASPL